MNREPSGLTYRGAIMQDPSAIRRRIETTGETPSVFPGEELAALADGGLDLDEIDTVRLGSIQMRYGPIAVSDVLAPPELSPTMPFEAGRVNSGFPGLRRALIAAGIVLVAGVVVVVMRGAPGPGSHPPIASQPTISPGLSPPTPTPSPDPDAGRLAISDPASPTREVRVLALGPAALGLSIGWVAVLEGDLPRPATRSNASIESPTTRSGEALVLCVVESIDPGTGDVLVLLRGPTRAWVSAEDGAIRVGDGLALSETPGMLRRSALPGAKFIAGEDLEVGEKMIGIVLR